MGAKLEDAKSKLSELKANKVRAAQLEAESREVLR